MMTDLDLVVAVIPECVHGCSETNVTDHGIEPFTTGSRLSNVEFEYGCVMKCDAQFEPSSELVSPELFSREVSPTPHRDNPEDHRGKQ